MKRWISALIALSGILIVAGCGPVSVGNPPGDDDDDAVSPPPTTAGTATFEISSSDPTLEMFMGEGQLGLVDFQITPVDGYTGTVDLSAKTSVANLDVTFEVASVPTTEVTLDGTNPVTVTPVIASSNTEVIGTDVTAPSPFSGTYELEFTDGTENAGLQVNAKVGPIWIYELLPLAAGDNTSPYFPHTNSINIPVGVSPIIVHNGAGNHVIHVNGGGSGWSHMTIGGTNFGNGLAWSGANVGDGTLEFPDLTDPVVIAQLEAEGTGVIEANRAGTTATIYCHTHQAAGDHDGINNSDNLLPVNILAAP